MVPTSTYRLQFNARQTFADAAGLVGYLADLGVGALYASPLLAAAPGSTHGYDVVDPTRASPELGGEAGRLVLVAALRGRGLGLVVDIVPNHLGVAVPAANPWWWDVLTYGRASAYAGFFDIDWDAGPILLPVLDADETGALAALTVTDGQLHYYEHAFPLASGTGQGPAQQVHQRQHYRLVSWRRGAAELTYRRFFDVSTLAALRVDAPEVFEATHREVLRWVAAGEVDGLRVDHPDGLSDPGGYLRRLRAAAGPDTWLLVEKILAVGESLPASWPVDGSTGYDAARELCGVFVDPSGEGLVTQFAAEWTGSTARLHHVERSCRRLVATELLVAEVRRIARLLPEVPTEHAEPAVVELLSSFPVYRSYLPEGRVALDTALDTARAARPDLTAALTTLFSACHTPGQGVSDDSAGDVPGEDEVPGDRPSGDWPSGDRPSGDRASGDRAADRHRELAVRVQQTSGMVMAKGVEDTAFYRWNRFVALNEVGGDPSRFGVSPAELHAAAAARGAGWPATMTTLSTHDTKRSEDVRARLAVLSELPAEWARAVRRWAGRHPLPEPSLELLAWQSLVGAWPISAERLSEYLGKAAKEAKLATSHVDPVAAIDEAIAAWPQTVLDDPETVAEIEEFVTGIHRPSWSNSLGQKLLQLAGPGVPDVYQGSELFDYSLVDPDNRRPVDWSARADLLTRLDHGWLPAVDASGAAKLALVARLLRLRRDRPGLFTGYRPLTADGPAGEHAVAFARNPSLVAVATRLPVGLARRGGWGETVLALPGGVADWTDVLTSAPVTGTVPRLADLLAHYPVACLVRG